MDAQKELVSEFIEHVQHVKDLDYQIENKNSLIKQLQNNITNEKEENIKLKAEIKTKNDQMKHTNKAIDSLRRKSETYEKDVETLKTNLNKKIVNLERKNQNLNDDLEQKKCELKKEKK